MAGRLFTTEERDIRANRRHIAKFILRAANPPAHMVELARRTLLELDEEKRERMAIKEARNEARAARRVLAGQKGRSRADRAE